MDNILTFFISASGVDGGELVKAVESVLDVDKMSVWLDKLLGPVVTLLIFVPLLRVAVMAVHRVIKERMTPQGAVFVTRWLWRIGLVIIVLTVLKQLGLDLMAIMGAAGIAGIAIGFAAQNSLSNVISGLFLMGERSVNLDDFIEVNGLTGTVETIGILSVILRTSDNKQVRIPNETILKGTMINYTRYPIRRFDFNLGVSYSEDLDKVIRVLRKVLLSNTFCLDEPEALVVFTGFGNSSCDFNIGAWCRRQDYDSLRNSLSKEIKEAFDREGIEIPYPYTVLTGGKSAVPVTVTMASEGGKEAES